MKLECAGMQAAGSRQSMELATGNLVAELGSVEA